MSFKDPDFMRPRNLAVTLTAVRNVMKNASENEEIFEGFSLHLYNCQEDLIIKIFNKSETCHAHGIIKHY